MDDFDDDLAIGPVIVRIAWIVLLLYAVLCAAALTLIPLSAAGIIERDPLSAIPAMLLGLPWSVLFLGALESSSEFLGMGLLLLACAVNAGLIWTAARLIGRWRAGR